MNSKKVRLPPWLRHDPNRPNPGKMYNEYVKEQRSQNRISDRGDRKIEMHPLDIDPPYLDPSDPFDVDPLESL